MRRKSYRFNVIQILLCIAIIAFSVVLFLRTDELTILFPVVFGLAGILSVLYALEGIVFNRMRVVRKGRIVLFGLIALILFAIAYFSLKVVI